jgi:hypothetical protein
MKGNRKDGARGFLRKFRNRLIWVRAVPGPKSETLGVRPTFRPIFQGVKIIRWKRDSGIFTAGRVAGELANTGIHKDKSQRGREMLYSWL